MKYTIKINEKGIEPVALSAQEVERFNVKLTGNVYLYAVTCYNHGDYYRYRINPQLIEFAIENCVLNEAESMDIVIMYEYTSECFTGNLGYILKDLKYIPIMGMRADETGEIEVQSQGKGLLFTDSETKEKGSRAIDVVKQLAEEALVRLNGIREGIKIGQ